MKDARKGKAMGVREPGEPLKGRLLALVFERTRVLWPCVLLHLAFNLAAFAWRDGHIAQETSPERAPEALEPAAVGA